MREVNLKVAGPSLKELLADLSSSSQRSNLRKYAASKLKQTLALKNCKIDLSTALVFLAKWNLGNPEEPGHFFKANLQILSVLETQKYQTTPTICKMALSDGQLFPVFGFFSQEGWFIGFLNVYVAADLAKLCQTQASAPKSPMRIDRQSFLSSMLGIRHRSKRSFLTPSFENELSSASSVDKEGKSFSSKSQKVSDFSPSLKQSPSTVSKTFGQTPERPRNQLSQELGYVTFRKGVQDQPVLSRLASIKLNERLPFEVGHLAGAFKTLQREASNYERSTDRDDKGSRCGLVCPDCADLRTRLSKALEELAESQKLASMYREVQLQREEQFRVAMSKIESLHRNSGLLRAENEVLKEKLSESKQACSRLASDNERLAKIQLQELKNERFKTDISVAWTRNFKLKSLLREREDKSTHADAHQYVRLREMLTEENIRKDRKSKRQELDLSLLEQATFSGYNLELEEDPELRRCVPAPISPIQKPANGKVDLDIQTELLLRQVLAKLGQFFKPTKTFEISSPFSIQSFLSYIMSLGVPGYDKENIVPNLNYYCKNN